MDKYRIYELDSATLPLGYSEKIAKLHMQAFPEFFLTKLGMGFLATLYDGYLQDGNSGLIVAKSNERKVILGFLAYSRDYSTFYKNLMKRHLLKFAIYAAGAVIRHPGFVKRLLGAFHKSEEVKRTERYVELASICVHPQCADKGVGRSLIRYLIEHTDFKEYAYISLETDTDNNEKVNRFYQKNGFTLARTYTTPEGRRMNEYHYAEKKA